ncbi:MAG TPA: hypothetical protein ENK52_05720 [Saprospiraceae bacterium]|nr:hypothetical protein [Saprospiraceae bacterium]
MCIQHSFLSSATQDTLTGFGKEDLYFIDEPQVILDQDMNVSGSIFIGSGVEVIVENATLRFGEGQGIFISRGGKLHVSHGTLTKCDKTDNWLGIYVMGNKTKAQPSDPFSMPDELNQAGIVLINNSSRVEWAKNAIVTRNQNDPNNDYHWGGLVYCENATFENNKRVAEFMKYDFPNKSKFINCTFEAGNVGEYGVSIWRTNGISFEDSRFNNMKKVGLLIHNATASVKKNDFIKNKIGVNIRTTHPFVDENPNIHVIDNNYFEDNQFAIRANTPFIGNEFTISNNEFFSSSTASIYLRGPSQFNVIDNSISGEFVGIYNGQTGAMEWNGQNQIRRNSFSSYYGIYAFGDNDRMQFLCNIFHTFIDFRLFGTTNMNGSIRENQGAHDKPAKNCFSSPQILADISIGSNTLSFNYFFDSNVEVCEEPITPGNYTTTGVTFFFDACADSEGFNEPPTYSDYQAIKEQISNLSPSSPQLPDLLEKKIQIIHGLLGTYFESGDSVAVINRHLE